MKTDKQLYEILQKVDYQKMLKKHFKKKFSKLTYTKI